MRLFSIQTTTTTSITIINCRYIRPSFTIIIPCIPCCETLRTYNLSCTLYSCPYIVRVQRLTAYAASICAVSTITRITPITIVYMEYTPIARTIRVWRAQFGSVEITFVLCDTHPVGYIGTWYTHCVQFACQRTSIE